jgi:alpha-L-arabinofuranosidase
MIPVPAGEAFLMPVAKIMKLYRSHMGNDFIKVKDSPPQLDVTASRTGDTIFLHVVNTDRTTPVNADFHITGLAFTKGKAFEISADPSFEIMSASNDPLLPKQKEVTPGAPFTFSPASVTAIELTA